MALIVFIRDVAYQPLTTTALQSMSQCYTHQQVQARFHAHFKFMRGNISDQTLASIHVMCNCIRFG